MISASRGTDPKLGFPGEDFLVPVPTAPFMPAGPGSITQVFITVEVTPDDGAGPSFMRILEATVPAGAVTGGVGGVSVPLLNVHAPIGGVMVFDDED